MTARDKGHVEEIIKHLKRVENDYGIDLTPEMKWLRGIYKEEPVSEDLEKASRNYADDEEYGDDIYYAIKAAFKAGAKWGINREKAEIQAQSMALAHGCPKEHISEELEEAAKNVGQKYFPNEDNIWARPNYEAVKAECAFKDGANWQKERMMKDAVEVEVKIDAGTIRIFRR